MVLSKAKPTISRYARRPQGRWCNSLRSLAPYALYSAWSEAKCGALIGAWSRIALRFIRATTCCALLFRPVLALTIIRHASQRENTCVGIRLRLFRPTS